MRIEFYQIKEIYTHVGEVFNIGCANDTINSSIHTYTFNIDENYLLTGVLLQ